MTDTIHKPLASCGPFLTRCGMRHPLGSIPVGWWDHIEMPQLFKCVYEQPHSTSPTQVEIDIELQDRFEFAFPDSRKAN